MRINTYTTHVNQDGQNILVKENSVNYTNVQMLSSPGKIVEIMSEVFNLDKYGEEHVYMIALNSKCSPIGFFQVSHGTVNTSLVQPRELLIRALLVGAVGIIICHNHPSGFPVPSELDIKVTRKIKEACDLVGIILHDHAIIGNGSYLSFHEEGLL